MDRPDCRIYRHISGAFRNHMDKSDQILSAGKYIPNVTAEVTRSKMIALVSLENVAIIDLAESYNGKKIPSDRCEHAYQDTVIPPTCIDAGFSIHTCTICGDTYKDTKVSALGHAYVNGVCAICGKTAPNDLPPLDELLCFDDVQEKAKYYYEPVFWAYNHEPQITKGVDDTHFGPDASCTRGQVVTFLWRAAGCPEPKETKTDFTDLKAGAFYEKAVAWAVENEITNGTGKTTFSPDITCTRGQIVTFLWRFKDSPKPEKAENAFTDLTPGAFYEDAVAWAVANKVTNGMTDTTFAPDATCTRGQVVTFLYRAVK